MRYNTLETRTTTTQIQPIQKTVYNHRTATECDLLGLCEHTRQILLTLNQESFRIESLGHTLITGVAQHGGHIVTKDVVLIATDLHPAGVVADHSHDGQLETHPGVDLCDRPTEGAVTVQTPDHRVGPRLGRRHRKAGAHAQRAEHARIQPRERRARLHDVAGRAHKIAAVGHQHTAVGERSVDVPAHLDGVHELALAFAHGVDLLLARRLVVAQHGHPRLPLRRRRVRQHGGQLPQKLRRIGQDAECGRAVLAQVDRIAVGRDQHGARRDRLAVAEPKVAGDARQHAHVRLAQRHRAAVAHLQRVVGAQETARHAAQVGGHAQALHRLHEQRDAGQIQHRLGADHQHRTLRLQQVVACTRHLCLAGQRVNGQQRSVERQWLRCVKDPVHVATHVPRHQLAADAGAAAHLPLVPLAHRGLRVEQIQRELDHHRTGRSGHGHREGALQGRRNLTNARHVLEALDVWL
mmetsp:Transcript_40901/g.103021  ORF Transcript_40901/g.103021 Transcript_40901/m.103021 type:complete len:466 (-) Transcript_40901:524-1921(-)